MNIVILGGGSIGFHIASLLAQEQHNVILIDKDSKRLEKIGRQIDIATVCGSASNWKLLDDLLEYEPDFFIALTGKDEINLSSCVIAKNLGYPKTISLIKETGYLTYSRLDFRRLFYVDHFIGADILVAHDILESIIHSKSTMPSRTFAHGMIQMRSSVIPDNWNKTDVPIANLNLPEELIIGLIRRADSGDLIIPHGEDKIYPKDEITVIGETKTMGIFDDFFGTPKQKMRSCAIIGGSGVAVHLAKILETEKIQVKIIEKDEQKCKALADIFENTVILNHDGTDLDYLRSEKIETEDAFITCTHSDDTNFLLAALGKQAGAKKIITLLSDAKLSPILRQLDIHFAISTKINIGNRISSIIHGDTVLSIASLCDDQAKVFEIKVSPDSKLIGIPLAELGALLPKDLLIAVIENKGQVMIGRGNRILSPNDTVIVMSKPKSIEELYHLF